MIGEKIIAILRKFKQKYDEPDSLMESLGRKYEISEYEDTGFEEAENVIPLFKNDTDYNLKSLERFLELYPDLENVLEQTEGKRDSYEKLLNLYKNRIEKLKDSKKIDSGEKITAEVKKVIKNTLHKFPGSMQKGIQEYMKKAGVEVFVFPEGHQLTDDDLCCLEGDTMKSLSRETDDVTQKNQVIRMVKPVLKFPYLDDEEDGVDEIEFIILEGECEYYYCRSEQED